MRKHLVIAILIAISAYSYAQPKMLGQTKSHIIANSYLPRAVGWFENSRTVNDSITVVQLRDREDKEVKFLYYCNNNRDSICTELMIVQPLQHLAPWLRTLNNEYTKTKDSEWVSKKLDLVIVLRVYKDEDYFATMFYRPKDESVKKQRWSLLKRM